MVTWLLRLASLVALAGFAAAVWYGGPMIGFNDSRPLEPIWLRLLIIAVPVTLIAAFYAIRFWNQRQSHLAIEAALAQSQSQGGDANILSARMKDAIDTLKRTSRKRNFLYELPWYVIIGPPGAGKTTALVNSGLKFPLAGSSAAQPVAGVGGTRYCDWWFTEDAVLIDTAGRYTTQDSDSDSDKKSWLAFLALLKRNRGRQPINGVILALSLEDLMTLGADDLDLHAIAIRNRLQELRSELGIDFPVYMLFTKADLVAGFMEFFGSYDEEHRRKVWGATFQAQEGADIPAEFEALARRLSEQVTDRIQEETDVATRPAIFGFPAQFDSLKDRVGAFLAQVFKPERKVQSSLRGFYFSSGTQEGTPIDQLLGAMARSFGRGQGSESLSGTGKSFFLHDLLQKVIFAEAAWVTTDKVAERRAAMLRYGGIGVVALGALAALAVLGVSFSQNRALVASTDAAVETYRASAAELLTSPTVADVELANIIAPLQALRNLPTGYESRAERVATSETFGFSQRERLKSASEIAYRQALERMLRPRLLLYLEQLIEANIADPVALYEPLKVYLMLGGKAPKTDQGMIVTWMRNDWAERYPGADNAEGRAELEAHLRAMLQLSSAQNPIYELNQPLVESAQRSLGRMSVADRALTLVKAATYQTPLEDFKIAERAGAETPLVFETTDGSDLARLKVPGLYTYSGFNDFFLPQLSTVADKLSDDEWVIGAGGEAGGIEQELLRLGPDMLDSYSKEFIGAWNGALDKLKFKSMSADRPDYLTLSAAAAPSSPIRQLFEAIAHETALTRPPAANTPTGAEPVATDTSQVDAIRDDDQAAGLARIGIDMPSGKSQSRAGAAFANAAASQVPGANIEAQFRPFQTLASGPPGRRPIDALIKNFQDIRQSLTLASGMPDQDRPGANLQLQISNLRANVSRLPKALSRMVSAAADDFEGDAAETSMAQLNQILQETVARPCEEVLPDRFPFAGTSSEDIAMEDFAMLFAPGGIIDRFFAQNLAPMVNLGGQNWEWKQDTQLGRKLSRPTLKKFQLAAEIRDAFFSMGGSTPAINITFTPFSLNSDADMALLDINGQVVQSYQTGSSPGTVTWPGGMAYGSANLSLTPELPGRESALRFDGPWALKRLLNAGTVNRNGENLEARFVIGGRDVTYTLQFSSIGNPFTLPALSEFSCPTSF